jgi:mannose-6-phosphate isomerase
VTESRPGSLPAGFVGNGLSFDQLEANGMTSDEAGRDDQRPWGFYRVLEEEPDHKVKRIVVWPGKRLSLQRHRRRSEHWYVVTGRAIVTLDGEELALAAGESVDIATGTAHRMMNPGPDLLAFIEVQRGSYFGEDDIERLHDDFGRA